MRGVRLCARWSHDTWATQTVCRPRASAAGSRSPSWSSIASPDHTPQGPKPSLSGHASVTPSICILGGGVGGLNAAIKLDSLAWPPGTKPTITLVDNSTRFVFKPLLYELLSGTADVEEVAPTFASLLQATSVRFIKGEPAGLAFHDDLEDGMRGYLPSAAPGHTDAVETASARVSAVRLRDGGELACDWVVLALGARHNPSTVPGVKDHAHTFYTYDDARSLRAALGVLRAAARPASVAVVGAGYAGTEIAAILPDLMPPSSCVTLFAGGADILPVAASGQRAVAREALRAKGVEICTGARVVGVEREAAFRAAAESEPARQRLFIRLAGDASPPTVSGSEAEHAAQGSNQGFDMVVWTTGATADPATDSPSRECLSGLPTTPDGSVVVDDALRVDSCSNALAIGDVVSHDDDKKERPWPRTAQAALQQADCAAGNLRALVLGDASGVRPFRYVHLGEMMSLGSRQGAVTLPLSVPPPLAEAAAARPALRAALRAAGVRLNDPGAEGGGLSLEGPLAATVRRLTYLYRQPTPAAQGRAAASILKNTLSDLSGVSRSVMDQLCRGVKKP